MVKIDKNNLPKHVAIIMDGNGRWAKQRGLSRVNGHKQGAETVREIVRATREMGIPWLTLYAFSEENWKRPRHEIRALMSLLSNFLKSELNEMMENDIRLLAIGRINKLPDTTKKLLNQCIQETSANKGMSLILALSYGGRQELTDAVRSICTAIRQGQLRPDEINDETISKWLYIPEIPDPDLLIRTSGEYRISNFLLWQIAYTEFYVTSTLWPDFSKEEYLQAIYDFQQRERRFGAAFD